MSATGLRERRIADTAARIVEVARRWTAERGVAGFTVEELCGEVGVSRRTFFNYFAAKEDAVLGVPARVDHEGEERFLAGGARVADDPAADVLADLADLLLDRHERLGIGSSDLVALIAAIEREPRLLARVLGMTRAQEASDVALVEQREHLEPGDLRANLLVHLLCTVLRGAIEETLQQGQEPLRAVFARRLRVARLVFAA